MTIRNSLIGAVLTAGTLLSAAPGWAQSLADSDAVVLVASPALRDADYRQTVVICVPIENNRHIGVIINRPTQRSLASLFPDHGPSKKVLEPVFYGGPMSRSAVIALVHSDHNPGRGSIGMMKDLFLAMTVSVVDQVIEKTPNQARYYVGYIVWRPGELRSELDRRVWYVVNGNTDTVFRKDTSGLWEEMLRMARSVTAQADSDGAVALD